MLSRSLFGKSLLLMVVIGLIIPFAGEAGGVPMLKDFYAEDFLIGFAARSNYWMDEPLLDHFNAVTA